MNFNEELKNPENDCRETPFHIACQYGNFKIAELLLKNCAMPFDINFNAN